MSFFRANLDSKGRIIRAVIALALAIGCIAAWWHSKTVAAILGISALFVAFEAARGWCALRACGLKTKF